MKPLPKSAALAVTAMLVWGCGPKEDAAICSNGAVLEARTREAQAAANAGYERPVTSACPELDLPLDGKAESVGLTEGEYAAALRGANGNFLDDRTFWVKATPRGASRVIPVQITAERCEKVTFEKFGYDYSFATPPLVAAPPCGRYLTGINVGHQLGDGWPQIFSLEGSGVVRFAPLAQETAFGAFLRLPRDPSDAPAPDSTLDRIDVVRHDGDSLELVAVVNGPRFASASRLVLKVGSPARLSVQLEIHPRAPTAESALLAAAALSGWFSRDRERDFERVQTTFADGTSSEIELADPELNWGQGEWTSVPLMPNGSPLESIALLQNATLAGGNLRPNVTLSNFQSSVPLTVGLAVSTRAVLGGNVIANLLVDTSGANEKITVSYLVTVALP
jgi:hypothetical protein